MKAPSPFQQERRNPPPSRKIKLLCSFNGAFQQKLLPPGSLRYVGGETRIVAVDRDVGISRLLAKIAELRPKHPCFCIKYRLPEPDYSGDRPLVSVDTDEDVRWMVEEHDRLAAEGKNTRLRIFLCDAQYSKPNLKKISPIKYPVRTDGLFGNPQLRRNHRAGTSNIRNHRFISYGARGNQNIAHEVGNLPLYILQGKHASRLRAKGGVPKLGHGRLSANFGKAFDEHYSIPIKGTPTLQDVDARGILTGRIWQPIKRNDPFSVCCARCALPDGNWNLTLDQGNLNYNRAPYGFFRPQDPSSCICYNITEKAVPFFGPIVKRENFSGHSDFANLNTQCAPTSARPICFTQPIQQVSQERGGLYIANFENHELEAAAMNLQWGHTGQKNPLDMLLHSNETQVERGQVNADAAWHDESLLDLSLMNLSLSSSMEAAPSKPSPPKNFNGKDNHQNNLPDQLNDKIPSNVDVSTSVSTCTFDGSQRTVHQVSENIRRDYCVYEESTKAMVPCFNLEEKVSKKVSLCSAAADLETCSNLEHFASQQLQTIKNSDLEEIRELGTGTYGTVFYGKWRGSDVAIKRIKPSCFAGGEQGANDRLISDFWKEASLLSQLHHPNVVAFYGVVSEGPATNLATVTEFMVNGSLNQVLRKKDRTIDRRKRIIIAMDAAFGMEYLHEKKIIHFDLKSHNFLVNMRDPQRPVCKIGDLGLSKVKQRTLVSGGVRGTIPWMAPELLTGKSSMVNEKVDVYSFGMVMWELLTGEEPYSNIRSEEIIAGILKGDLRPDIPSWCDPSWRSLMERCWSSDPGSRPSFTEIAKELRSIAATANIK